MKVLLKIRGEISDNIVAQLLTSNVNVLYTLNIFSIVIAKVDNIDQLSKLDFIEKIEFDDKYKLQSINIIPKIRENKLKKENFLGFGVKVAILDSGINEDGKLVKCEKREIFGDTDNFSDETFQGREHGTIVAKIVKHIAPGCNIYNVKILNSDKNIYKSNLLRALDWSYNNGAQIINMSISRDTPPDKACDDTCMVCNAVNTLYNNGILVVSSIGNYGGLGRGITGCPGNAQESITVGAVSAEKRRAIYSAIGRKGQGKPNIVAPGCIRIDSQGPYKGTSFAAPIVTGVCAAIYNELDAHNIRDVLYATALDLGLPEEEQGKGLVNIERIIEVIKSEKDVS